jgi:hypothetical protein
MPAVSPINALGPLPRSDRNNELEELSFKAFDGALPPDRFCLRDERGKDRGVDASIELLIDGCHTNFHSDVQLKGTDSQDVNDDGSISLSVAVSNLNYLLNGPSPLYVLYVAPRREIRYVWAHDERRRLDSLNPEWMQQGEVTLRFAVCLTPQALIPVHERICREGRMRRRILDTLGRATTPERVVIGIDPTTLVTTDPEALCRWILADGMTLVAAGYGREVLEATRLLNPDAARLPRVHLVCGYAQFTLGRYQAAAGHLAEAGIGADELSARDCTFLASLRNACDHQTGRTTAEEYLHRQESLAHQQGGAALEHRLQCLRHELVTETQLERRRVLVQQLREVATQIGADGTASPAFRLQARLLALQEEGVAGVLAFSHALGLIQMRLGMGLTPDLEQVRAAFRADREHTDRWERAADDAVREAVAQQHPLLFGEALLVRVMVRLFVIGDRRVTVLALGREPSPVPDNAVHPLMADAEEAMKIFAQAGNLEGELRARMLLADLFELAGQQAAARSLAEHVLPRARAMGYTRVESLAQDHLSGGSMMWRLEARIRQGPGEDNDARLAAADDEEMRRFARDCLAAARLPPERFPIVERECFSLRDVAREHLRWCKHLEVIQDLRHTRHVATHYREDPERWCHCALHGDRSAISSTDWGALISAFKQTRCQGCPDRAPKGEVA